MCAAPIQAPTCNVSDARTRRRNTAITVVLLLELAVRRFSAGLALELATGVYQDRTEL